MAQPRRSSDLYTLLGEAIRAARKRRELTQEQLAMAVGLTRTSVVNVEKGRQKVPLDTVYEIALALGTTPDELMPAPQALAADATLPSDLSEVEREWVKSVAGGELKGGSS